MTNRKSNLLIMAAFFTVMSTMLLFIMLVPDKTLVHWVSLLFILLAEFVFFIAQLYWEMTLDDRRKPASRRLIRTYFIVSLLISLSFLITGYEEIRFLTIIQIVLLVALFVMMILTGRRPIEHFPEIDYKLTRQFARLSDAYVHTIHSEKLKELAALYTDDHPDKATIAFRLRSLEEALNRNDEELIIASIEDMYSLLGASK